MLLDSKKTDVKFKNKMDRTLGNFDAGRWMKNKTGDDYTYELTKIDRCGGAGWQCVNALVKKN